jgi:hypothetical protein
MSRYLTLIAERKRPIERAVTRASSKKRGKANTPQVGAIPNQTIRPRRTTNDNRKSTRGVTTEARGIINRGK